MKLFYTIGLLIVSNIFMTFAWYGHLKLQQLKIFSDHTPLYVIIFLSWMLALPEYTCQVPANRIGFDGNGGPFNIMQLKVIQEVISLTVFTVFVTVFFNGETLKWNHLAAAICLILAVYFVFYK
ncbi:MAG: DMT family protein [Muribaculaceae bacterium]|nr:DMT family protein [Muribaculaceae bacterium]